MSELGFIASEELAAAQKEKVDFLTKGMNTVKAPTSPSTSARIWKKNMAKTLWSKAD